MDIISDKKDIYIRPVVQRKHDGVGKTGYVSAKLKYSCDFSELGNKILEGFDYILSKYDNDGDIDENNEKKSISWQKRARISICKEESGQYRISSCYVNHEIMTYGKIEEHTYPSDVSAEQLGKAAKSAFEVSFDYALRQEIAVYYSDNEGLLFIPMARNKTVYVPADYCELVSKPFKPGDVAKTVRSVFDYAAENPCDKRTKKERQASLPWRNYSKYKSIHGFIKTHHSIEMHRLTNGSIVFLPKLRFDGYYSHYREYDAIKTIRNGNITDSELTDEIFSTLERSRLITQKSEETDGDYNAFCIYLNEIKKQTNNDIGNYFVK